LKTFIHLKALILLILVFSCDSLLAQDLVKQKDSLRFGKAKYYVLKSDKNIKHGSSFIKSYLGTKAILYGQYSYGEKDGEWMERYPDYSMSLKSVGQYNKGEKIGLWNYYDLDGEKSQVYNHSSNTLIYPKICSDKLEEKLLGRNVDWLGASQNEEYNKAKMEIPLG
jgi:hypothetical protein